MSAIVNFFKNLGNSVKDWFINFFKNSKKQSWRRSAWAIALTVMVVVAIVAVNVLFTALATRFPLMADITAQQITSLTDENIDFIRGIDKEVVITVCAADAESYSVYVDYYAQNGGYSSIFYDSTGQYYTQTPALIERYSQYNSEYITVKFVDPSSVDFYEVKERQPDINFMYGDILVECKHTDENGKEYLRSHLLSSADIYELAEAGSNGYYSYYTVSGNRIESQLTTAINRVIKGEADVIGYLTGVCDPSGILMYKTVLADNNYDMVEVKSLVLGDGIPAEVDTLVICDPSKDFSAEEIAVLEALYSNGGEFGKNIMFFPDPSVGRLNNLYDFMEDHDIVMGSGTLYETDTEYQIPGNETLISLHMVEGMFTENHKGTGVMLCDQMIPIKVEANGESVHELIATTDTCVVRPYGSPEEWKPSSGDAKGSHTAAALSCDIKYDNVDDEFHYTMSSVVAFASSDFLTNQFVSLSGVDNSTMIVSIFNSIHVRDKDEITFFNKTVTTETFIPKTSTAKTFNIIFVWVIPVLLVATSIIVFIRRKSL